MGLFQPAELFLIVLTVAITWFTFNNNRWFNKLIFQTGAVIKGQWYRLISAGFLHVSWNHLFFNMITLYFFAGSVEGYAGIRGFLLIYMGSLVAGNVLALVLHRHNPAYRAVGASGAVSGVVYAAIAFFPGMELAFIFVPVPFPAWVYGIGFILYSLYGIGSQRDNIGHEAHLGGAIAGLLIAIGLEPSVMETNPLAIIYILVPAVVVLVVMLVKPGLLRISQGSAGQSQTIDDEFRERRAEKINELNRILDKVRERGEGSLTADEKEFLKQNL